MSATFFGLDPDSLEQKPEEKPQKKKLRDLMRNPLFLKPLGVGCMMMIIQQVTGLTARVFTDFSTGGRPQSEAPQNPK